jgi:hypothetical protein
MSSFEPDSNSPQPPTYSIEAAPHFDFGLIFRTALQLLRNNLLLFLAVIFLIDIPLRMLPVGFTPDLGNPEQMMLDWPRMLVALILFSVIRLFPVVVYYRMVGDMLAGERRLLLSIIVRCLGRYPVVVIAALIYGAAAFVGLMALIVPGVIILVFGCCYAAAAVIREQGVVDSLIYSVRLVKGNFGYVFLVQIGIFVALLLVNLLVLGASAALIAMGMQFIAELAALFALALVELIALLTNAAMFLNLEGIQRARSGASTTNAS